MVSQMTGTCHPNALWQLNESSARKEGNSVLMHPALMGKERNAKAGHLTMIAEETKQKTNPKNQMDQQKGKKKPYYLCFSLYTNMNS